MSAEEYGGYSYYISILGIASMICAVFFTPAVFYTGLGKFPRDRDRFSSIAVTLSCALSLCICAVLFTFSDIFGIKRQYIIIMLLQLLCDSVVTAELMKCNFFYNYKRVVSITLFESVLSAILSMTLIFLLDLGATGRILGLLISAMLAALALSASRKKKWENAKSEGIFLLKNALPLLMAVIARAVVGWADKLIVKAKMGEAALAKYSVAHTVGAAAFALIGALSSALGPWIIRRLKRGDGDSVALIIGEASGLISWGSVAIVALAPELFSFLAPEGYKEALYAIAPLALSSLPFFLFNTASIFAGFFEMTKTVSLASAMGAAASVTLGIFLVPRVGYLGGGLACLAAETVMYLSCVRAVGRKSDAARESLSVGRETLLSLIFGCSFIPLYDLPALRILMLTVPVCEALRHGFTCLPLIKEKQPL